MFGRSGIDPGVIWDHFGTTFTHFWNFRGPPVMSVGGGGRGGEGRSDTCQFFLLLKTLSIGCPYLWALVSEPGFLKFQIFRFSILEILFGENIYENYVGEISRNK